MASKSVTNVWTGRHKDICGLLGKWRGVEKDGVWPDSLRGPAGVPKAAMRRRWGGGGEKNGPGAIHLKQLAEALKITAEVAVQEWNDVGLAVTRMDDVHVNRQAGRGDGGGE